MASKKCKVLLNCATKVQAKTRDCHWTEEEGLGEDKRDMFRIDGQIRGIADTGQNVH